ncbi:unnamed protein product [Miscanthus lutarioriparius]|uniref:Uncharacterized protein n=1 Tax=Miscanthus lutarioriparius TaxID=422564 RepID=A0A811Q4N0_9POAL|nr:unnamed protein product [Miscanthus lutarioriparius]
MEQTYWGCPFNMPMSYPSRGFNQWRPGFPENAHLLHHGWQPAGQLFGQQVHRKRSLLQQEGTGRFSDQGYRPRDAIFVHGGEEISVSEAFCSDRDSVFRNSEVSNPIMGARRVSSRYDAGHGVYGVGRLPRHNVDGLIQIGGQQFKWAPIKSRDCNQPVTCSDALGAVHGMKTDDILIDKPELAAGSGDSGNDARQQQQGPDAFQKKYIVVENDGLLADSDCDSLNNSEKPVAITSTSQEPESSSIPANSVMRSSSKVVVPGGMSDQWRKFSANYNLFRPKTTALIYRPRFLGGSRIRSVASGTKPKPQWYPAGLTHTQKQRVQRL